MKNGDLIVNGNRADQFVPEDQTEIADLVSFEFAVYDAYDVMYGEYACDSHGINDLVDVFGQEMHDRIYRQRVKLMAQRELTNAVNEMEKIRKRVENLKSLAETPTTNLGDVHKF